MGGKSSTSTQSVQIPPEVLARYNQVNQIAQQAAGQAFTPYSTDPNAFVAGLTPTQQAGIANTNAAAGSAQPFYQAATGQLQGAQQATTPFYQAATQALMGGQQAGAAGTQAGYNSLNAANAQSNPYIQAGMGNMTNAYQGAQPYNQMSMGNVAQGQQTGAQLAGQSLGTLGNAQQQGAGYTNAAYQGAQGYNQAAGQQYAAGLAGAQPLNQSAISSYYGGQAAAAPLQQQASQGYNQAYSGAQGYNQAAGGLYGQSLQAGQPLQQQAQQNIGQGLAGAQPYNQAAGGLYGQSLQAGQPLQQSAQQNISGAQAASQPFNQQAAGLAAAGTGAVNAQQIGADQINQFQSPYIQQVLQGTAGMLNQQNQQAMSGQTGNAIMSGAFGGDRAGIAAANLAQQQQLANSQTFSNILNQGYGQALSAAQQQQGVNLGASQANRAALQQASNQMLGIGQQNYAQGIGAAQQQAALGQQLYGQAAGAGQNLASLGQQQFGQNLSAAQQQAALGQQLYGQAAGAGQNLAALGSQQYQQGMGTAEQQAALGQQLFGQGAAMGQGLGALGQQVFGQGQTAGQNIAALGQQQYQQGMGAGNQLFNQGATAAGQQAALGQQQFGQSLSAAQQQAALGQQQYQQGMGLAQGQLQGAGQIFNQGATTAQQQAALAQQAFGQGAAASTGFQNIGQGIYNTGAQTSQQLAALGQGLQGAGLTGAQAQLAAGQIQQQTQQAGQTAMYNQFLQQQGYPFQIAQFLANIAEGTGALSGSTTTSTAPGGFGSDERLKQDIRPIGKTHDGQTIYSYRYNGEHRTQIGLLAQEVEKKHPEAVGDHNGYKTVDYKKATMDAERDDRLKKMYGGSFSDRKGYAYGGGPGGYYNNYQSTMPNANGAYGNYNMPAAQTPLTYQGSAPYPTYGAATYPMANYQPAQSTGKMPQPQQSYSPQPYGGGVSGKMPQQQPSYGYNQGYGQQQGYGYNQGYNQGYGQQQGYNQGYNPGQMAQMQQQSMQGQSNPLFGMGAGSPQSGSNNNAALAPLGITTSPSAPPDAMGSPNNAGTTTYQPASQSPPQASGKTPSSGGAQSSGKTPSTHASSSIIPPDIQARYNQANTAGQPTPPQAPPQATGKTSSSGPSSGGGKTTGMGSSSSLTPPMPNSGRGFFADGGAASMGGGVHMGHYGEGFAEGGSPYLPGMTSSDMAALLQAQAAMYGQQGNPGGVPSGAPRGGTSHVPPPNVPVSHLVTAGPMPKQETDLDRLSQISNIGRTAHDIFGKKDGVAHKAAAPDAAKIAGERNAQQAQDDQKMLEDINNPQGPSDAPSANDAIALTGSSKSWRGGVAGGRGHFADGGLPYSTGSGGIDIPDEKPNAPKLATASGPAPQGQSALGQISQLASGAEGLGKLGSMIPGAGAAMSGLGSAAMGAAGGLGSAAAGLGSAAMGAMGSVAEALPMLAMFSDKRLKHNIKPIGKTFDGQTVYSFNYHGEPRTQIGLLAQEVEHKHPDAVGLAGGYKTVDYKKATEDAERARRYAGGRAGYEDGGFPDDISAQDDKQYIVNPNQPAAPQSLPPRTAGVLPQSPPSPRTGVGTLPQAQEHNAGGKFWSGMGEAIQHIPQTVASSLGSSAPSNPSNTLTALALKRAGDAISGHAPQPQGALQPQGPTPPGQGMKINPVAPQGNPNRQAAADDATAQALAARANRVGGHPQAVAGHRKLAAEATAAATGQPMADAGQGNQDAATQGSQNIAQALGAATAGDAAATSPPAGLAGAEAKPAQAQQPQQGGFHLFGPAGTGVDRAVGAATDFGGNLLKGAETGLQNYGNRLGSGEADAWIPLLSGLGAMATTPTRSLGVAAGQGLRAAAENYYPTAQAAADIQSTQAGTTQTNVNTAATLKNAARIQSNGRTFVILKDGSQMLEGDYLSLPYNRRPQLMGMDQMSSMMRGSGFNQPSTGKGIGPQGDPAKTSLAARLAGTSPAISMSGSKFLTPEFADRADTDYRILNNESETAREAHLRRSSDYESAILSGGAAARNTGNNLNQFANSWVNMDDKSLAAPGAFSGVRTAALERANDAIRTIKTMFPGLADGLQSIDQNNLDYAAEARKLKEILTFAQAHGADQNSLGALRAAAGTVASPDIHSKTEGTKIIAAQMRLKQEALDEASTMREYGDYVGKRYSGQPNFYDAQHAEQVFRSAHGSDEYDRLQSNLEKMLNAKLRDGTPLWTALSQRKTNSGQDFNWTDADIERQFNIKNFSRIIGNQ